jgi:polyhydroxybutyrate depolymerase
MRWPSIVGLSLLLPCACAAQPPSGDAGESDESSGTSNEDEGHTTTEDESDTSTEDESDSGEVIDCEGLGIGPGNHERTLEHGGLTRSYVIHVPNSLDPQEPAPLLLNMHGYMSNPTHQMQWTEMNESAGPRGWIVVYPLGTNSSWNAGVCCGQAVADQVDDVGFLRAVVDAVASELCVDPKRIHATGMSNGGYMSHRLACEAADLFASVAPVAGAISVATCAPSRPISVLAFHGVQDTLVSYASDLQSMTAWAGTDGCDSVPAQVEFDGGDHRIWSGCDDDVAVEFYTLDPMGHCWPSGWDTYCFDFLGPHSDAVDANAAMLDFFDSHRLPSGQ